MISQCGFSSLADLSVRCSRHYSVVLGCSQPYVSRNTLANNCKLDFSNVKVLNVRFKTGVYSAPLCIDSYLSHPA